MRSAGHGCLACDLPGSDWFYESLDLDFTEIEILELRSRDRLCAARDDNAAGFCQRLQPGGKIRGVAEDAMLLGNRAVRHVADKCDARCNTDARAQFFLRGQVFFCGQSGDRLHYCEAGLNGALRVVFVRVRIAEIYHRAVAMMSRDKAVEAGNGFGNAAPVAGDDCAKIFGIEPRGERSRSDQVTKQHRKLPALDRARSPVPSVQPRENPRAIWSRSRRKTCSGPGSPHRRPDSAALPPLRTARRISFAPGLRLRSSCSASGPQGDIHNAITMRQTSSDSYDPGHNSG